MSSSKRRVSKTGRPPTPGKPVITREQIETYVTEHAKFKNAEKKMSELRENILELFHSGASCERTGWNILVISAYERTLVDWEAAYRDLLADYFPDDIDDRMDMVRSQGDKKPVEAILIKPNAPGI